jgi:alkylation response protein AidB-like acyl-CoA dehydrogenase
LAGISTFARKEGDYYIVNGQKIWTSMSHVADHCMLLVRTNRDVAKHKGLSYLLMDMKSPGVEVRPIRQITGEAEFNEVFMDDVRIPLNMLVGKENEGWMIAIATLMFERVMGDLRMAASFLGEFGRMVKLAGGVKRGGKPVIQDPLFRQQLAQCYIELMALKYSGYRSASKLLKGHVPGPEGSIGKLLWSETHKRMGELAMQIQGPYHQLMEGSPGVIDGGAWQYSFLRAKANTIEAGSSEILRNIIGERVLGLPKDVSRAAARK